MKTKLSTFIILISMSNMLFAQLIVNAGHDTAYCFNSANDSVKIGGNPTAQGGVEPYTYSWTGMYPGLAKDMLNDTSVANPIILDPSTYYTKLRLTVKDNSGVEGYDSITVFPVAFVTTLIYHTPIMDKGDTIVLPHNSIGGGIEPITYYWTPDYNISDTRISNPLAWPDSSTVYEVYVIDAIGCRSGVEDIPVTVNVPLDVLIHVENKTESWILPNPIDNNSRIYLKTNHLKEFRLKVINTNGQIVISDHLNNGAYEIGDKIVDSGMYLYLILDNDQLITSGQFIKK